MDDRTGAAKVGRHARKRTHAHTHSLAHSATRTQGQADATLMFIHPALAGFRLFPLSRFAVATALALYRFCGNDRQ
jgi:hypothetical protein